MPEYKCIICEYITDKKSNYNNHIQSKKHKEKEQHVSENILIKSETILINAYNCQYCNTAFSTSGNLSRHRKICIEKKQLIEKNKMLEENTKKLEERMQNMENHICTLAQIANTNSKTTNIVVNDNLKHVKKNYCDAEPLLILDEYNRNKLMKTKMCIKYNKKIDGDDLIKCVKIFENWDFCNKVHIELGNILINEYQKTKNPEKQSFWCIDASRLVFLLNRQLDETEKIWQRDVNGIKLSKLIIEPIIKAMEYIMKEYCIECTENLKSGKWTQSFFDDKNMSFTHEHINKINESIFTGTLVTQIKKYISSFFQLVNQKTLEDKKTNIEKIKKCV